MATKKVGKASDKDIASAAEKTHLNDKSANTKANHHKLKPHHAKSYRKRHYGSLFILVSFLFIASLLLIDFSVIINHNTNNAKNFLSNNFASTAITEQTIESSYGYKLQYNPNKYYAAGITSTDNKLYVGTDLSNVKDYKTIVVSSNPINKNSNTGSITLNYLNGSGQITNADLQKSLVDSESSPNSELIQTNSSDVQINNVTFLKTNWQRQYNSENSIPQLSALVTTYTGNVNGIPMTIVINHGLTKENTDFIAMVENLNFDNNTMQKPSSLGDNTKPLSSKSILDNILFSGMASAAESSTVPSEKIAAMYSPAVVRIYNLYCQNAKIDNIQYLNTVCSGGVGSGFLISSDGYIATNGHVASSSVKEMLIAYAIEGIYLGDDTIINKLYSIAGGTEKDLMGKSQQEAAGIVFDKIYQIPDNRFSSDTSTHNMLVTLGEAQPNVDEIKDLTANNSKFTETENIKIAKPIAIDYRAYDGINGFKASDVALIKIEGSNYPTAKIGNFDQATQGANLNIIGFPAGASGNGLVEEKTSKSTLTTGKVTAIKDVNGSKNKLIETDSTIGHGNSGGPAFLDNGEVIGIATYTIDGSGDGDGVFNYIRSISDLNALAQKSNITFITESQTQDEWNKGIDNFYKAHYSKAIKSFEATKAGYAVHPTADTLIATSKAKIAAGEEVKEFPIIPTLIALVSILLIAIVIVVIVIIRHKKKHNIYKQINTPSNTNQGPVNNQPPINPQINPTTQIVGSNTLTQQTITPQTTQPFNPQQPILQPQQQNSTVSPQPLPTQPAQPIAQPQFQPQNVMPNNAPSTPISPAQPTQTVITPQPVVAPVPQQPVVQPQPQPSVVNPQLVQPQNIQTTTSNQSSLNTPSGTTYAQQPANNQFNQNN